MKLRPGAHGIVLALGFGACVQNLSPKSIVTHLRVLDIIADPPEVMPGAVVNLHAIVVGNHTPPTYVWTACVSPAPTALNIGTSDFGVTNSETGCSTNAATDVVSLGNAATATLTVPPGILADAQVLATVYGTTLDPATLSLLAREVGVVVGVGLTVQADGYSVTAYKRVIVSTNPLPEQNPPSPRFTIEGVAVSASQTDPEVCVTADGGGVSLRPGETVALVPDPDESWLGSYTALTATGQLVTVQELAFYSWYATNGSFSQQLTRSPIRDDQWIAPSSVGAQALWLMVRNGHGGSAGCSVALSIDAPPP